MPCCSNCVIIRPSIEFPPPLIGFTNKVCKNCGLNVSDYSHNFCYLCAIPNSVEYLYHHSKCKKDDEISIITEACEECEEISDCDSDDEFFSNYIPHIQLNSDKKVINKFFDSFIEYLGKDSVSNHVYSDLYQQHRAQFEEAFHHFMKYHVKDI